MPFTDTWDETSPNGAVVSANTLDTIIKNEVKRAVRERMESLLGIADFTTRFPMSADAFRMSGAANPYIIGGTASWAVRSNDGLNDNIKVTDAGVATIRAGLVITTGGLTVTAGGITVTAGTTLTKNLDVGAAQARIIEHALGNITGATALNWNNSNNQAGTLTGSVTFTFSNPIAGCWYQLRLTQGGAGSYTVTWPANVKWQNGAAPTLTTTVGYTDMIALYYNGTNYLAALVGVNWNG